VAAIDGAARWLAVALAIAVPACEGADVVVHESDEVDRKTTRLSFDPSTVATVTGRIAGIEGQQRIGRSRAGVRVRLRTENEDLYVYLAPRGYFEHVRLELVPGQIMEVRGSVLDGDGHRVVIAQSMKVGSAMYPLRDHEGRPKWHEWRASKSWK